MKTRPVALFFGLLAAVSLMWSGNMMAQERPQEGQDAGRIEMSQQIRAANSDSFDQKAIEALRHARKEPLMTALQSTNAFLELDRNHDTMLIRSELPEKMSILRAQFDRYDLDRDHRLSYSEFANYTDRVPNELANSSH